MTRTFQTGRLYGFRPTNTSAAVADADYQFEGDDVRVISIDERARDYKDNVEIVVDNKGGQYTSSDQPTVLEHGDRIQYHIKTDLPDPKAYGTGLYGSGPYSPSTTRRWTGMVGNYNVDSNGRDRYVLELEATDFVYAVMSMRRVTNAWDDEQIVSGAGTGQGIINTILEDECPELDLSQLPSYSDTTTISLADENVLESIIELANRADLVLWADHKSVRLNKSEDISTEFEVTTDDYTLYSYSSKDDALFNTVRVEGGEDREVEAEQTTQDGWTTVTESTRFTKQLSMRKSEVSRVEVWTDPERTGSQEDMVLRLQKDEGGAPIAPGNTRSDIARRTLAYHFLAKDGFTSFDFPDHSLPPNSDPWLIIETSGGTGHDIGIRTSDNALTFRSWFPYPIRLRREDVDSQDAYREREDKVRDDNLSSFSAARERGRAFLDRHALPDEDLSYDADSDRLHDASAGTVLRLDHPEIDLEGRFVVIERSMNFEGSVEETSVTLRDLASL